MDYDRLAEVAAGFGRNAEAAAALQKAVQHSVEALQQGGWEGRGSVAFFTEMQSEIMPALQR
ncbi:MAG: WXG100 family type VII secretion target, partial [Anaerolineae bacterium]